MVNENLSHGPGRQGVEMTSVLDADGLPGEELEIGLVHHGCRAERASAVPRQLPSRNETQLRIHQGK